MNTSKHIAKRLIATVLTVMMLMSMLTLGISSASAAKVELAETGVNVTGGETFYLNAESWGYSDARYAMYLCNGSSAATWVNMTLVPGTTYMFQATAPTGQTHKNIIFVRMNGANNTNDWSNKWNQTADLTWNGTSNCFKPSGFDGATTTWSTYTPPAPAKPGDASAYYLMGTLTDWNTGANMVYADDTTVVTATTSELAKGEYKFKIKNGEAWLGNSELSVTLAGGTKAAADGDGNVVLNLDGGTYTFNYTFASKKVNITYVPAEDGGDDNTGGDNTGSDTTFSGDIWADVDGDPTTTYDKIVRSSSNTKFYLPSAKVTMFVSEGSVEFGGYTITPEGTEVDLATGSYKLGSSTIKVFRSKNVSSMHTETKVAVPQGTYQGYEHKDDYETKGTIGVFAPDGTQKNSDTVLKKIKGRGNSSWEASHKIVGKYAFNITLDKKAKLIDDGSKSKKYCLVSYNADQARMRNMVAYELAEMIGSPFAPQFEPIDFYNNGKFAGSYLLTDKVEIGDPLVDIVNLDDVNEELNAVYDAEGEIIDGKNFDIYEADDISGYRGSYNGSLSETSAKGYYKYVNLEECDASEYEDSGFLLEFELNERFDDEISGFISSKGQQIVCKYPEYASKNQIKFIMNKWNAAEALMYNKSATYEQLDAVIDVESFAKMYLIQELSKNLDGGATSFYVYYDGGKLHAGVSWDYDWAFGQYRLSQSEKIGSSDFGNNVDADPSTTGGWYLNSKKIYGSSSTLNAQAALCQNDAFWGVVVAEWDEVFYNEFSKFTKGTVSSTSQLTGIIGEFYETVKYSTIMDEDKWGIIAKNSLYDWGSTETGSDNPDANNATHDKAVVWLNNWLYNRVAWMDKYISRDGANHGSSPYNVDYVIQPPAVKSDKAEYAKGDTVTLTITDKTGGTFTYTIYKDGTKVGTTDTDTFTFTADEKGEFALTVKATSQTSSKTSAASKSAKVAVTGCGHVWDNGVCTECGEACAHETVKTIPGKDATCTETGLTDGVICGVCDIVITAQDEIPAKGHAWDGNTCTACGKFCDHAEYEDGKCTVCGKEAPATFEGSTITLEGNIGINFFYTLSEEAANDAATRVRFVLPNGATKVVYAKDAVQKGDNYVFSCEVAAKEMTATVKAQLITSDAKSEITEYSVQNYANAILENKDNKEDFAKAQSLVKAMLNYGAAAQVYFNYNTSAPLANETKFMTDDDRIVAKADFKTYKHTITGEDEFISYYGSALSLNSETSIKHYFVITDETMVPDGFVKKNGLYMYEIKNIGAHELHEEQTVEAGGITVSYNAFSYGYLASLTGNVELNAVMDAMYAYNQAAVEYNN